MRHLARALYPATLAEPATLAATEAALAGDGVRSHGLRMVLLEQEAILRSVLAARSVTAAVALSYSSILQRPGVGGDVDGVGLEDLQRDDLERALVGRGQHHRSGGAVPVRLQPVGRGHAPPVPRHQPGEPELGHRRGQVVADPALMFEEFGGYHGADGVTAQVLGAGRAASVPVEAGERVGSTRLKLAAEHITVTHACSIVTAPAGPQDRIGVRRLAIRAKGAETPGTPGAGLALGRPGQASAGGLVLTVWSVKT